MHELIPFRETNTFFTTFFDWLNCDTYTPNMNNNIQYKDTNKEFLIRIELPGFTKEQISINIEDNILKIKATSAKSINGWKTQEKYYNEFLLSKNTDVDKIVCELSNGILLITIPKEIPTKITKTIEVK